MRRTLVALALLAALGACGGGNERPAATISDPAFVRAANAVCRKSVPQLRAPDRKATSTTELRPKTIDATADGVAAVAEKLRALPVQADDRARVDAWLDDWAEFAAVGHRYANAVAADDPAEYTRIDDKAVGLSRQIATFARGNRIDDCVL